MLDPTTLDHAGPGDAVDADAAHDETVLTDEALVEEELLVEEISIDGMCGVY